MTAKKKSLAVAEGLKPLSNDAVEVQCEHGSVLVSVGVYGDLDEKTASSLTDLGWLIDTFTGDWCFCV